MKITNAFIKYWLPIILWAGFIYFLSDQPSLKSSLDPMWDTIIRKITHVVEFAIFAFLLSRALGFYKIEGYKFWFAVLALSFFYAVYDEVHQSYVQGRYGTVRDMLIDFNGAVIGAIAWNLNIIKKKKKKRKS